MFRRVPEHLGQVVFRFPLPWFLSVIEFRASRSAIDAIGLTRLNEPWPRLSAGRGWPSAFVPRP